MSENQNTSLGDPIVGVPDGKQVVLPETEQKLLDNEAMKMMDEGYNDEQIADFMDFYKSDYIKKKDEQEYTNSSKWWKDSGLNFRDEKHRRTDFSNIITSPENGMYISGEVVNKTDDDKLTPEMAREADRLLLRVTDENREIELPKIMKELNDKFNPTNSKYTDRNIKLILENAQVPAFMNSLSSILKGTSKRDLLYNDPQKNEEIKASFVKLGYPREVVDNAWEKQIHAHRDKYMSESFVSAYEKDVRNKETELNLKPGEGEPYIKNLIMTDALDRAKEMFGKDEIERMNLVKERDETAKQLSAKVKDYGMGNATSEDVDKLQAKLKDLEEKMSFKTETKVEYTPGISSYGAVTQLGQTIDYGTQVTKTPGIYDAFGNRYGAEEDPDEQAVKKVMEGYKNMANAKDLLTKEMIYRYGILKDAEFAEDTYKKKLAEATKPGYTGDANAVLRTLVEIQKLSKEARINYEGISRMLFLNQDIAMIERDAKYYAEAFVRTITDKNGIGKNWGATEADVHGSFRELANHSGIGINEEEIESTKPSLLLDITKAGAEITDFAIKMALLNKGLEAVGIGKWINALKTEGLEVTAHRMVGATADFTEGVMLKPKGNLSSISILKSKPLGNISSTILDASVEGAKFATIGLGGESDPGKDFMTGMAFHLSGMALPNLKFLGHSPMGIITNNFYKASVGMTVSQEAIAQGEAAIDAIQKDKNVGRAMTDAMGGDWENFKYITPETARRVLVELASALPFGFTTLKTAREMGYAIASAELVGKLAKEMKARGLEDAPNFEKIAALLGTDKTRREVAKLTLQEKAVRDFNASIPKAESENATQYSEVKLKKNASISEIREAYKKVVEQTGVDTVAQTGLNALKSRDPYTELETPFLIDHFDEITKIGYLEKKGIDITEMDSKRIREEFEYQKQLDIDNQESVQKEKAIKAEEDIKATIEKHQLSSIGEAELRKGLKIKTVLQRERRRLKEVTEGAKRIDVVHNTDRLEGDSFDVAKTDDGAIYFTKKGARSEYRSNFGDNTIHAEIHVKNPLPKELDGFTPRDPGLYGSTAREALDEHTADLLIRGASTINDVKAVKDYWDNIQAIVSDGEGGVHIIIKGHKTLNFKKSYVDALNDPAIRKLIDKVNNTENSEGWEWDANISSPHEIAVFDNNIINIKHEGKMTIPERQEHLENELKNIAKEEGENRIFRGTDEQKEISDLRKEISDTKVSDKEWESKKSSVASRLKEAFDNVIDRVGIDKVRPIVETYTGMSYEDFYAKIAEDRSKSSKRDIQTDLSLIENVLNRVERGFVPKKDAVTTEYNPESKTTLPSITMLKKELAAYDRGWNDGRVYFKEQTDKVIESIRERLTPELVKSSGLKQSEIDAILKPLPPNADQFQVMKHLDKLQSVLDRIESRSITNKINDLFDKVRAKAVNGLKKGKGVDPITGSTLEIANSLFNVRSDGYDALLAKIDSKMRAAKEEGRYGEVDIYQAQKDAIGIAKTGRANVLERQLELAEKQLRNGELTFKESLEYTLLDFFDGSVKTRDQLSNLHEELKSLIDLGKTVKQRVDRARQIKDEVDKEEVLSSLGYDRAKIESLIKDKSLSPRGLAATEVESRKQKTTNALKNFVKGWRMKSESFYTLMEYIMRDVPDRVQGTGILHSFSNDFFRARERQNVRVAQKMGEIAQAQARIWGSPKKASEQMLKNSREQVINLTRDGDFQQRVMTVNQAYHMWQNLHSPKIAERIGKQGWGVYIEGDKAKFDPARLKQELEDFIIKYGGKESLEFARWQIDEFYKNYYGEVNEVYRRINGTDIPFEYQYSPVFAEAVPHEGSTEPGKQGSINPNSVLEQDIFEYMSSATPGNVKTRTAGEEMGVRMDIDGNALLHQYVSKMEHYMAFQEAISRGRSVLTDNTIKSVLAVENSPAINGIIEKFFKDISNDTDKYEHNAFTNLIDRIRRNFVVANLGLNLGLFPKQVVSLSAYRMGLGASNGEQNRFAEYLSLPSKEMFETIKFLANTPFVKSRISGGDFERELTELHAEAQKKGAMAEGSILKKGGNVTTPEGRKLLWGNMLQNSLVATKLGDMTSILFAGQAFYRVSLERYKKQGYNDITAQRKAYEDFVRTSKLTQQSGYVEDLSHFQRMGSYGKMLSLFQNTPLQYFRIEAMAVDGMTTGYKDWMNATTEESKALARSKFADSFKTFFVFHFLLPATFRAASQGFYLGDDTLMEDTGMLTPMFLGSFSYIFMFGQVFQNIIDQIATGHSFDSSSAVSGVITEVLKDIDTAFKSINFYGASEESTQYENAKKFWRSMKVPFALVGELAGVPTVTLLRYIDGMSDLFNGLEPDVRKVLGFPSTATGDFMRSPDYKFMRPFLDDKTRGLDKYIEYMTSLSEPEEIKKNAQRWVKEFRMYQHFGGWNPEVNHLYFGRLTTPQKVDFLYRTMQGRETQPIYPAKIIEKIVTPARSFEDPSFQKYLQELVSYGVIGKEVVKQLAVKVNEEKNR